MSFLSGEMLQCQIDFATMEYAIKFNFWVDSSGRIGKIRGCMKCVDKTKREIELVDGIRKECR